MIAVTILRNGVRTYDQATRGILEKLDASFSMRGANGLSGKDDAAKLPSVPENEVRLWLSVIAYNLGNLWRRLALQTRLDTWSLTSLQRQLMKAGGRLIKHARCYWLLLVEGRLTGVCSGRSNSGLRRCGYQRDSRAFGAARGRPVPEAGVVSKKSAAGAPVNSVAVPGGHERAFGGRREGARTGKAE